MTREIDTIVLGASGYVGGELLRLIVQHPTFRLRSAISSRRAGTSIGALLPTLANDLDDVSFSAADAAFESIEQGRPVALFAAAPHGACGAAIAALLDEADSRSHEVHVVDASADFRYHDPEAFESVYGQPHPAPELIEHFRCALPEHAVSVTAPHVGHPGCFATAVILAAVPAFADDLIEADVYVNGITGSTGSGRSPSDGTHHPERHSNLYAYKPLVHRHVPEIEAQIAAVTGGQPAVHFVPHSGPFARGIYVTLQARLRSAASASEVRETYRRFYADAPFVHVVDGTPKLKDVVASNHANIAVTTNADNLVVLCAIDNLVKGAAGGAMQWMNRLWSLPETSGLSAPAPGWT